MSANDPSGYVIDPEAQRQDARTDREQLIWATLLAAAIEAIAGSAVARMAEEGAEMNHSNAAVVTGVAAVLADTGLAEFRARWPLDG